MRTLVQVYSNLNRAVPNFDDEVERKWKNAPGKGFSQCGVILRIAAARKRRLGDEDEMGQNGNESGPWDLSALILR